MEEWCHHTKWQEDLKPQLPASPSHYSVLQNPLIDSYQTPNNAEIPCQGKQNSLCWPLPALLTLSPHSLSLSASAIMNLCSFVRKPNLPQPLGLKFVFLLSSLLSPTIFTSLPLSSYAGFCLKVTLLERPFLKSRTCEDEFELELASPILSWRSHGVLLIG